MPSQVAVKPLRRAHSFTIRTNASERPQHRSWISTSWHLESTSRYADNKLVLRSPKVLFTTTSTSIPLSSVILSTGDDVWKTGVKLNTEA